MRLLIRFQVYHGYNDIRNDDIFEVCIPKVPEVYIFNEQVDMLFGYWFTGNVQLYAQIMEIEVL